MEKKILSGLFCIFCTLFLASSVLADTMPHQFTFTVQRAAADPLTGVRCYVFNHAASYLGLSSSTDSSGKAFFNLADGAYRLRVDYLGYQFWSGLYDVPASLSGETTIPHQDVVVTAQGVGRDSFPLPGLKIYLFTAAGAYQGQSRTTDAGGRASFSLPAQPYQARVDYLGKQFWSEVFVSEDVIINIPMADTEVTVTGAGTPLSGVKVYVFSAAGTYLGISGITDANGKVPFTLAEGNYRFRADYQGGQYWSVEGAVTVGQANPVTISTGGGTFTFRVMKGPADPMAGVKCYVFNQAGTYLGLSASTDSSGTVSFNLADGSYKLRIDYLGYQFWSGLYDVPATLSGEMTIPHRDDVVTVQGVGRDSFPLPGLKVYLFTAAGAYQGQSRITDENGQASFDLPGQAYKVRVDYLGEQFWSEDFVSADITVNILMADTEVEVTGAGLLLSGVKVYVFSAAGTYLGISGTTDANGKVLFTLAEGEYKFRIDYQGSQYWSDGEIVTGGETNSVTVSTGGGTFTFRVVKGPADPMAGVKCYVFNQAGTYLGLSASTDSSGTVSFNLADGSYKLRIDYLGYQFWSDPYDVPVTLSGEMTVPHQDVTVTVEGLNEGAPEPMQGLKVYLFSASGVYQGQSQITDVDGAAVFNLPEESYKVRVDYLGQQFWSTVMPWQNAKIVIPLGGSKVAVSSGGPLQGVKVYVFSTEGSYLGVSGMTDASGYVTFNLAAGTYNFRADFQGSQYWSGPVTLIAGQINPVAISTSRVMLAASDGQAGDHFGASVSLSEGYAVIGAPGNDGTSEDGGAAYVFSHSSPWSEYAKLVASDSEPGDQFGVSVSINGAFAIVGAHGDDDFGVDSGSAYLFHHDGDAWIEQSKIVAGDGRAGDRFGCSVSIAERSAIVGAEGYDGGGVGEWDGSHIADFRGLGMEYWWDDHWQSYYGDFTLATTGTWANGYRPTKVRLTHNSSSPLSLFSIRDATGTVIFGETSSYVSGQEVILDCTSDIGQIRIVPQSGYPWITGIEFYTPGAPGGEDSGAVYLFRSDGAVWSGPSKLVPNDTEAGDHFGASVSVDGDYAIVGAFGKVNNGVESGAAYIFKFDGSAWVEEAKLVAYDTKAGDRFGSCVSISADYAIVGADSSDEQGVDSGAAYVFRRHGSVWTQEAKLTASDGQSGDHFGASVSLNGSYAAAGAVAGDKGGTDSGAVYLFKRNGADWIEEAEYASAASNVDDRFGTSVSLGSGHVLSGATNSDAQGTDSGSASVYAIDCYHEAFVKVSPETIPLGGSATLSWSSINASSVDIDSGIGPVPLDGSLSISPSVTTTYTMTAIGPHGTDINDVTITVDQPPSLTLIEPDGIGDRVHNRFTIQWVDADAEENARISLYYDSDADGANGILIVSGLEEDPDGSENDAYVWDTASIPEGSYFVYAVIDDGCNDPVVVQSANAVVVDHELYPETKITFASAGFSAFVGSSVSMSGEYAIVGAPEDSLGDMGHNGSAYILRKSNGSWIESSKLIASDVKSGDFFGNSVSISGDYAIVSAYGGGLSRSAYIFNREGSRWTEQTKLVPGDVDTGLYGWSVSISGDQAAVGAPGAGSERSGAVYLFKRDGSSWVQEARLTAGDASAYAYFGISVSINGDDLIIGAGGDSVIAQSAGSAYIFRREGSTWVEQSKLAAGDGGACDGFGSSVSIDGDYAIIGAPHSDYYGVDAPAQGSAYIFKRMGSVWTEEVRLVPINGAQDDHFGNSVSISGDYAVVGAPWAHEGMYGNRIGSVYVFKREGSMWKESVELMPSPESYSDVSGPWFGSSVDISGPDIIVGAPTDYPSGSAYTYSLIPILLSTSMERIPVGGSATLSWNCPGATSVTIDNNIGSVMPQGSISVSPAATTTYTITAVTPFGLGTQSVTVTVVPLEISISAPIEGATIDKAEVTVEGSISDVPGFEIGVNVNGVVAMVDGDHFVASHVRLAEGENIITATAVDTFEHMASASITINAETSGDYVRISADPESGVSPLESTLKMEASFSFANSTVTYTGPGVVEFISNPNPSEYQVRIATPGLYAFTVEVKDAENNAYTETVKVLVLDAELLDGMLREKWNRMKEALINNDMQRALKFHHGAFRDRYESIYNLIGTNISALAQQMQNIELVFAEGDRAKYAIPRNHEIDGQTVTITYFIYFSKDNTGLWKIERY